MDLQLRSGCKINLILNILGKRPDGFHELETLLLPIPLYDLIYFSKKGDSITLTTSEPKLPVDDRNLIWKAANLFYDKTGIAPGIAIHLEKNIPMEAGLGGGSSNAAATLKALNRLYDNPVPEGILYRLAEQLGSDVPFFLQDHPAIGTGRGEKLEVLEPFPFLAGKQLLLIHPGFGVSTPWAYQQLGRFPAARSGTPGRAWTLAESLHSSNWSEAAKHIYNSLEAPVLDKYPILQLFQENLRRAETMAVLMSGSGSTTFGLFSDVATAGRALESFKMEFGESHWTTILTL